MQTLPYFAALGQFCELAGYDPLALSDIDTASFNRLFNLWFRRGWEFYFWPQLAKIEERALSPDGLVLFEEAGREIIDTINAIYRSLADAQEARPPVPFRLLADGALVQIPPALRLPSYWVEYRPPCPVFDAGEPDAPVPAFLGPFAVHGAYTTWLRGEGQQGKALQESALPWDWLYDEVDKIERQQSQTRRWRFRS